MTLWVFFGVLGGLVVLLVGVLLRRGWSRTEHAEGLRIEERARVQAAQDRTSYNSWAVHNAPPNQTDAYQRRR
ncbi:hypothetical protein ACF1CG_09145 [Streptomyces sp. NPDC014773]|uniref:hypothetical protein n=1 Tax=Streptomyces sp. NPDC014773 TaxID=3364908 RepID=UPI0036FBE89B